MAEKSGADILVECLVDLGVEVVFGYPGGAVLDGRDIGTVIAPDAPAKLFITATPEVRAMRRWKQLTGRGDVIAYEDMLADIRRRDARDAGRGIVLRAVMLARLGPNVWHHTPAAAMAVRPAPSSPTAP